MRIGATVSPSAWATCIAAPERRARVARGGLHPEPLERALAPDARVGHAVEGDAAGQDEVAVARARVQPAREVEQDLLEAPLDGGGEVGVGAGELAAGSAAAARSGARSTGSTTKPPSPSARTSSRKASRCAGDP